MTWWHEFEKLASVSLPLSLAQRILAALVQRREWVLAAELRSIVGRKT